MGICVYYGFELIEKKKQKVLSTLKKIRKRIMRLSVIEIGDIFEIKRYYFKPEKGMTEAELIGYSFALNLLWEFPVDAFKKEDRKKIKKIIEDNSFGLGLKICITKECDPFYINLGRLGKDFRWQGGNFTKLPSGDEYEEAYSKILEILEICREEGILESVFSEAEDKWLYKKEVLENKLL
tara:strand:+ start:382 stop:924 length:543 start_codon:yes stop_codon:yes gene_type:complete